MNNQETTWLLKEKYQGVESEAFHADCEHLAAGEPLAYIIGSIPFLDCTIHLDSKPLIPRPETEFWVEKAISAIKATQGSPRKGLGEPWVDIRILDLCAGSGAIGVAVAKAIPEASVTFAELDQTHLPTIKKNLTENLPSVHSTDTSDAPTNNTEAKPSINRKFVNGALSDKSNMNEKPFIRMKDFEAREFQLIKGDLFENIPKQETFDFILSNPPYIDRAANTVDENVATHEPHLALFGGVAGMEIIEQIVKGARAKLAPQGQLWLEHEPFQTEAIIALGGTYGFTTTTHPDQYGTLRYSVLCNAVPK